MKSDCKGQCSERAYPLGACTVNYERVTGEARGEALGSFAGVGAGFAVVLLRCGPAGDEAGEVLLEGVASSVQLFFKSTHVGGTSAGESKKRMASSTAHSPSRPVMIHGDSSDACGSA